MRTKVPQHVDDRGQAVPVMMAIIAMAVVLVWAVASMGPVTADAARARTAADAAALAGAAEGEPAAAALAAANGAELVSFAQWGDDVEVRVRVGSVEADARATASVRWERPHRGDD